MAAITPSALCSESYSYSVEARRHHACIHCALVFMSRPLLVDCIFLVGGVSVLRRWRASGPEVGSLVSALSLGQHQVVILLWEMALDVFDLLYVVAEQP